VSVFVGSQSAGAEYRSTVSGLIVESVAVRTDLDDAVERAGGVDAVPDEAAVVRPEAAFVDVDTLLC
jgi:hypothetical protein